MRLLVVDHEPHLASALRNAGYDVDLVRTGDEAEAALSAGAYALMMIEHDLPSGDGLALVRALRARRDVTPVIMMSAHGDSPQKVEALDAGGDDYVVRPCHPDELLARIRAHTRPRDRTDDTISARGVVLDLEGRTVSSGARRVPVTAKELRVLAKLMRRPGQYLSKQDLQAAICEGVGEIGSNTVEVTICALRRKLGPGFIVTARGLGYAIAEAA